MIYFFLVVLSIFLVDFFVRLAYIYYIFLKIKNRKNHRKRKLLIGTKGKLLTISLLGDSVLYGEGSEYELPAVDKIVKHLVNKRYRVIVNNYAITGHTITDMMKTQLAQIEKSDLIVIYIGANDYFRFSYPNVFNKKINLLLKKLHGKTVIWCTLADPRYLYPLPIWLRYYFYELACKYMLSVNKAIEKHTSEQWYVVDFLHEAPKRIKLLQLKSHDLLTDGFHLSVKGHELWCSIMYDEYLRLKKEGAIIP